MTPVILDGTVYLGLLICIILLAIMIAILTKVMVETRHYVQMHGLDLGNVLSNLRDLIIARTGNMYLSLAERFDSVDHKLYNSRKRECETLRRQTAQANRMIVMDASIMALANEFARVQDDLEQRGTASFVALNSQLLDLATLTRQSRDVLLKELVGLNEENSPFVKFLNKVDKNWRQGDAILKEVKKGNKDQQEIKTRLTWDKKRDKKLAVKIKKTK